MLSFTARQAPSSRFAWLLYPLPAGSDASQVSATLEPGSDGNEVKLVVRSDARSDYVKFPGCAADASRIEDYAVVADSD